MFGFPDVRMEELAGPETNGCGDGANDRSIRSKRRGHQAWDFRQDPGEDGLHAWQYRLQRTCDSPNEDDYLRVDHCSDVRDANCKPVNELIHDGNR